MVDQIRMPQAAYSVAPSGRVKRAKRDKGDRRQRRFPREGDKDQDDRHASATEMEDELSVLEETEDHQPVPQPGKRRRKGLKTKRTKRRGKRIDIRI